MALDRLRALNFYVVAPVDESGVATITIRFGKLPVDLDSGTVKGIDILTAVSMLDDKIKEAKANEKIPADSGTDPAVRVRDSK